MKIEKILFVDDCEDNVELFVEIFRFAKLDVRGAPGGSAALTMLNDFKPDLVFVDLEMADVDGFAVADAVRNRADSDEIVLVAVSGWSQEKWIERARLAGFCSYLVKPMDIKILLSYLEKGIFFKMHELRGSVDIDILNVTLSMESYHADA